MGKELAIFHANWWTDVPYRPPPKDMKLHWTFEDKACNVGEQPDRPESSLVLVGEGDEKIYVDGGHRQEIPFATSGQALRITTDGREGEGRFVKTSSRLPSWANIRVEVSTIHWRRREAAPAPLRAGI